VLKTFLGGKKGGMGARNPKTLVKGVWDLIGKLNLIYVERSSDF